MLNKELLFAQAVGGGSNQDYYYTLSCKGIPKTVSRIDFRYSVFVVSFWVDVPCVDNLGSCSYDRTPEWDENNAVLMSGIANYGLYQFTFRPSNGVRIEIHASDGQQNIEPKSVVYGGKALTKNNAVWEIGYTPLINGNIVDIEVTF